MRVDLDSLVEVLAINCGEHDPTALPPDAGAAELPLAPGQHSLWFMNDLVSNRAAYHVGEAQRLRGRLYPDDLRRAVRALADRHEVLRTCIRVRDGVPYQVVAAAAEIAWEAADVSAAANPEAAALELIAARSAEPFDLAAGSLFRVTLVRLGPLEHVFALTMHQIISDRPSTETLFTELSHLYNAFRDGRPAELTTPPASYSGFARLQQELRQNARADQELACCSEKMTGAPADTGFPIDRLRPAVHGNRGSTLQFDVPAGAAAAVRDLARAHGTTEFTVLLAGFIALFARYSRARDIVVGTPVSSRTRGEFSDVTGFWSNMAVLRADCSDDPIFGELLARTKDILLSAAADGGVPFPRLVSELAPDRDLSRHPLFQVTFQAYQASACFLQLRDLTAESLRLADQTSRFDLSMTIETDGEGQLHGFLNYNVELFLETTAQQIAEHFRRLLSSALASPERRLSRLQMLGDVEQRAILARSVSPFKTPRQTIKEMVGHSVELSPNRVAISSATGTMSYQELDAAAGRIAGLLSARGFGPDNLVAVCLERDPMLVAALLGIAQAGAAYLPIDPGYPAERVKLLLGDSGAGIMLTQRSLADRFPDVGHVIVLDDLPSAPPSGTVALTVAGAGAGPRPADLAYVMYTSGSTGRPKGVGIQQQGVVRLVHGLSKIAATADDTFLMLAPVAFDASTIEVWVPLAHSSRLAIYPPGPVEPHQLGAVLAAEQVSVLFLTAQLANLVVDTDPELLRPLRMLITGGEALSVPHMRRLREALPDLTIINAYGPTEVTTVATDYLLPELIRGSSVSIGHPIGDTRTFVLDADMNLVPVGVTGELYVGGPGTARGYISDPGLTATRFVADPIGPPGERLYRTGDLVRWHLDDGLEFIGRSDDQVKLRGFRVEPGEIAAAVKGHPAVRDAFVTMRGNGPDAELVAYLVAARELSSEFCDELRAFLRERLPGPMVPGQFLCIDKLPLSSSGKVDRKALPEPEKRSGISGRVTPRTDEEAGIAADWATLLDMREVFADDNFFLLGGDSLTAARAVSRLAARFGVKLPLSSIFLHPTVSEIAAEISRLSPRVEIQAQWSASDWLCLRLCRRAVPEREKPHMAQAMHEIELAEPDSVTVPVPDTTLVALFAAQAARVPAATAVIFEDAALTYRELDEQVQATAAYAPVTWSPSRYRAAWTW
jgi:amino acid adenylation domain-containing protein